MNALLPDLIHISNPENQTPANIKALLEKIKNIAPQLQSLKAGIKDFMKREGITMKNLHFVGYSQGGILAQMLAYSLPDSCGSVCFAGCPWVWTPDEDIKLPHSILMAINNDDPIFGNIYHFSRDIFIALLRPLYCLFLFFSNANFTEKNCTLQSESNMDH